MKQTKDSGTKDFLVSEVLLHSSDTLPPETSRKLAEIRRDKPSVPIIYVATGSAAIIAGSDATAKAAKQYLEEMGMRGEVVRTGCHGPAAFEPLFCVHLPGKNKLFFRNITEDKVEPLLNGVFHNDMPEEDLVGQGVDHRLAQLDHAAHLLLADLLLLGVVERRIGESRGGEGDQGGGEDENKRGVAHRTS